MEKGGSLSFTHTLLSSLTCTVAHAATDAAPSLALPPGPAQEAPPLRLAHAQFSADPETECLGRRSLCTPSPPASPLSVVLLRGSAALPGSPWVRVPLLWPVLGGRQEGKELALVPHGCFAPSARCQVCEPLGVGGTQMPCPSMGFICACPWAWLFSSCSGSPHYFQSQHWWAALTDRLLPGLGQPCSVHPPRNCESSPWAWTSGCRLPSADPLCCL